MSQKITLVIIFLLSISSGSLYSQSSKPYKYIPLDGFETGTPNQFKVQTPNLFQAENKSTQLYTESGYPVEFTEFGMTSYYDLLSNGSPHQIWQDPINPLNVHAAVMTLPVFGDTRVCQYVYSEDGGVTWTNFGNIAEVHSGFPSISGLSNGCALIAMQTSDGGSPVTSQVYVDIGPGFGAFNRQNPGIQNGNAQLWGRIIGTGNESNSSKYVMATSENTPVRASTITGTTLTSPGQFTPWVNYPANNAEQYCLARGDDGRIGNAYIAHGAADLGDVMFRESFDGGLSWTVPVKIFDANLARDTMSAFGGISMVYLGNIPCVTFEVSVYDGENLYPGSPSYIYFWKPDINYGLAHKIAGPHNVPFHPNTGPAESYGGYTPLCRPVIGKAIYSDILFIAMNAATSETAADSNVYYATYFMASVGGGQYWSDPERITPLTPLKDYRYVSMSPSNSMNSSGDRWIVQMLVQSHDYAGTFAPNQPPGTSDLNSMRLDFIWWTSDTNNMKDLNDISLKQNSPNPFNPTTHLEFGISNLGFVSLKVYDISGKEVATIVNKELSPGNYKFSFDGSGLTSGIYFYTLKAGQFTETKKMILIR